MTPPTLRLSIPRRLEREFRRRAKAAWVCRDKILRPRELYALLIGTVAGDSVTVDEIYYPDDVREHTGPDSVDGDAITHWLCDAREYAKEMELSVVGEVHTHPYTLPETGRSIQGRVHSERDLESRKSWIPLISGICVVQEIKRKGNVTLRASLKWWGATIPLEVSHS